MDSMYFIKQALNDFASTMLTSPRMGFVPLVNSAVADIEARLTELEKLKKENSERKQVEKTEGEAHVGSEGC